MANNLKIFYKMNIKKTHCAVILLLQDCYSMNLPEHKTKNCAK